ncbi:MAG: hypothetical protein KGJ13_08635 [Patescibacteria group bacterium]|nr:hypothetical protein [Patescibacteria group bacterium]
MVASRYILAIYDETTKKCLRVVSCDTDAEYYTVHAPRHGERGQLIQRDHRGIPSLQEVWDIQHGLEAELAGR